jgi:RNA polymerase sigma-70 factor (ECF subfamily)
MQLDSQEGGFVDLVDKHQGLIHKVCIHYETEHDAREDLFQEIVLQLWKSFPNFRGDSKITTWMYRIALNTAISALRKFKRKPFTEDIKEYHFNLSDQYDNEAQKENHQKLQWAIRQLPEIDSGMIMMALDEIPNEEIAETIGITQNKVRVRMKRLRENLRNLMG